MMQYIFLPHRIPSVLLLLEALDISGTYYHNIKVHSGLVRHWTHAEIAPSFPLVQYLCLVELSLQNTCSALNRMASCPPYQLHILICSKGRSFVGKLPIQNHSICCGRRPLTLSDRCVWNMFYLKHLLIWYEGPLRLGYQNCVIQGRA